MPGFSATTSVTSQSAICPLQSDKTGEEATRALARVDSPFSCAVMKAAGRVIFKTVLSSTILPVLHPY